MHGKLVRHASYAPSRNPQKGVFRGIPEHHGFKFTLAPRGDRKRPLKTALQQGTDRPFCTRRALKRQISSTSCRRAAACRNLSRKPAVPEIRLSRSPAQRLSGASEGFGSTQPLAACTALISASSAIHREHLGHFTGFPGPFARSRQSRCASDTDLPVTDLHQWNRRPLSAGDHFMVSFELRNSFKKANIIDLIFRRLYGEPSCFIHNPSRITHRSTGKSLCRHCQPETRDVWPL